MKTPMLRSAALTGLMAFGFVISGPAFAADAPAYHLDPFHSQILFSINHMGFSIMNGAFSKFDSKLTFDPSKPAKTAVEVTIHPADVDALLPARDKVLQSPGFFDTAKFPDITFKSTSTEVTGDDTAKLNGNLTMLGVTKPITLDVKLVGKGQNPYMKSIQTYGFEATGALKRSDFGWNTPGVGDEVDLKIDAEINNAPPRPPMPAGAKPPQ
jgi:polyisoprenoid-binding protein YceI